MQPKKDEYINVFNFAIVNECLSIALLLHGEVSLYISFLLIVVSLTSATGSRCIAMAFPLL